MKVGHPDGGAAGTDAARGARSGSRPRDRGLARVRAGDRRRLHPAVGGAASVRDATCRPRRCSIRSPTRSTCGKPFDKARARARAEARSTPHRVGISDIGYFDNMLHHDRGDAREEARLHAARVRRRGAARRRRGLRLRRPQPAAQHGPEPHRLRGAVHPAAEGRRRRAA